MKIYRITVQVTTDVVAPDLQNAIAMAMDKVMTAIGDNSLETPGSHERPMWVTGIARQVSISAAAEEMIYFRDLDA